MIVDQRIDAIWHDLAAAWGAELNEDDRARIKPIVDQYLVWTAFEANARPVAEARSILEKLTAGAEKLKAALNLLPNGDNIDCGHAMRLTSSRV